jgi:hypothetical protein
VQARFTGVCPVDCCSSWPVAAWPRHLQAQHIPGSM